MTPARNRAILDPQAAGRLAKILGLLGSHYDGEVAAAGRKAHQFLKRLGLDWGDVIAAPRPIPHWRQMAGACREFQFVNNMAMSRCEPTEKQAKWLRDIFERICT
jgi:hypothetical protein